MHTTFGEQARRGSILCLKIRYNSGFCLHVDQVFVKTIHSFNLEKYLRTSLENALGFLETIRLFNLEKYLRTSLESALQFLFLLCLCNESNFIRLNIFS